MKKRCICVLVMCVLLMTAGCSPESKKTSSVSQSLTSVSNNAETVAADVSQIDIDLSRMNALYAYSELSTMLANPDKYMGKIVKVKGLFMVYRNLEGENYFSCYVSDDIGCCSEQIYFVESQQRKYPDDYPDANGIVTVAGQFGSFDNCGVTYYGLVDTVFCSDN